MIGRTAYYKINVVSVIGGAMFLRHITDGNLLGIRITTQRYHSPVASSTNALFGHRKLRVYGTQLLFRE